MKSVILLVFAGLVIAGCAPNTTTGVNRQYDITMEIRDNWGPVTIEIPLSVDAMSSTDLVADQASDISPDVRFQLSEGAASGVMSGADAILKDVTSTLRNEIKERAIEKVKEGIESGKPATPSTPVIVPTPVPVPIPEVGVDQPVVDMPPASVVYETKFHHTQTAGPDKGKSLVLCPGQTMQFDSCTSDGVKIPWHGYGDGRETYWNMTEEPKGDIVCKKGDKTYVYPATAVDARGFTWGKCN